MKNDCHCRTFVLVGDANLDVSLLVPGLPSPGSDALASKQLSSPGGSASNTAVALARLGFRADLIAKIGRDAIGDIVLGTLEKSGVGTRLIHRTDAQQTPLNFVAVAHGGERTMFSFRGASSYLTADEARSTPWSPATSALYVSGYSLLSPPQCEAAEAAMERAAMCGAPTLLDVPSALADLDFDGVARNVLSSVHTVVVGPRHLCMLMRTQRLESAVDRTFAAGVHVVALKLGADGCRVLYRDGTECAVPSVPVTPVDTTGAGDAFCAGMLLACSGILDSISGALLGNILGALVVTGFGAAAQTVGRARASALLERLGPDVGESIWDAKLRVQSLLAGDNDCQHAWKAR